VVALLPYVIIFLPMLLMGMVSFDWFDIFFFVIVISLELFYEFTMQLKYNLSLWVLLATS